MAEAAGTMLAIGEAMMAEDTGAYTSFVNREVAKWLEQRQEEDKEGLGRNRMSSRHDIPT